MKKITITEHAPVANPTIPANELPVRTIAYQDAKGYLVARLAEEQDGTYSVRLYPTRHTYNQRPYDRATRIVDRWLERHDFEPATHL